MIMLISQALADAINAQVGREFGASMQYLQIATYFDQEAYKKLADFFYKQSAEEHEHAMKFIKYLVDTGSNVAIPPIEAPVTRIGSAEEAFKMSLAWEQEVTRQVNHLMDIAVSDKDYLSRQFLDWFVEEQLEEVNSMDTYLRIVQRVGEKNLIMLEAYFSHGE
jgi:ferritin